MATVSRLRGGWTKRPAAKNPGRSPAGRVSIDTPKSDDRIAEIFGPAADQGLSLREATIEERLGTPFEITLTCDTPADGIVIDDLLGSGLAVRLATPRGTVRWFHGMVAEAAAVASGARTSLVELVLRPEFWFLDNERDCRIFQNLSSLEIVIEVCSAQGIDVVVDALTGRPEKREYCVQYRESTFSFLSRLLEEEGIYYRFGHGPRRHRLELFDDAAAHRHDAEYRTVPLRPTRGDLIGVEHAWGLETRARFRPSAFACTDYDFESPSKSLLARRRSESRGAFEVFDYPGRYTHQNQGEEIARIRLEQLRSESAAVRFRCDARGMRVGSFVDLEPEEAGGTTTRLMLVATRISLTNDPGESLDGSEDTGDQFACDVEAVPSADQYRPAMAHEKVLVEGPQTAEVVGPSGEEIYTDMHGRVKVQFHWDRKGERDHQSSCWIRVSEPWAGKGWGGLQIPRIGQEVVVDFLEGDPDRPIITGRVYNGNNRPPQDLPAGKMISGMRSKTYKGRGHNEITFDDSAGSERMFVNAQYDQVVNVNNNRTTTVGVDSAETIGNDMSLEIGNNSLEVVGVDKTVRVGTNTTVSSGSNIVLEAGTSITLQCGASSISMNSAGVITISGTMVSMLGAGNVNVAAPMTNVAGGVMLNLAGAITTRGGMVTTIAGASRVGISGGKIDAVADGDHIIKGGTIKMN